VTARAAAGVTPLELAELALVPEALAAATTKVYAVPSLSPFMVSGLAAPDTVCPPGLAVTV